MNRRLAFLRWLQLGAVRQLRRSYQGAMTPCRHPAALRFLRLAVLYVLRHMFVEYQDLDDNEILHRTYERKEVEYDLWSAHEMGNFLDTEFHLEPEEQNLLIAEQIKDEFLGNKRYFYSSFIMMTYSFIERYLVEICFLIPTDDNTRFSGTRVNIYRVYKFLEKTLDYKITESYWNELLLIKRLRNILVHQGYGAGYLYGGDMEKLDRDGMTSNDDEFVAYLSKWKIYDYPSFELNFEFCQHLAKFTEELFDRLVDDLSKKNREIFII
jgi:hypothetical protein